MPKGCLVIAVTASMFPWLFVPGSFGRRKSDSSPRSNHLPGRHDGLMPACRPVRGRLAAFPVEHPKANPTFSGRGLWSQGNEKNRKQGPWFSTVLTSPLWPYVSFS